MSGMRLMISEKEMRTNLMRIIQILLADFAAYLQLFAVVLNNQLSYKRL